MGIYTEYLTKQLDFQALQAERKAQLKAISALRKGRDVLVYASDMMKQAPSSIDYSDQLPFHDQLTTLAGRELDIILETPGGIGEVVEDIVRVIRGRYDHVGIIIPGTAKSAGTIFAMAADEILMGVTSSLGPIDAQIINNSKRFSADAFLDGLTKIKEEVLKTGKLNPAYIPILQNISPGEIQHCENAQNFSKTLVKEWLAKYKFKYWETHSSTGKPVTEDEKKQKADQIAERLCKHGDWLTHGRSIKIDDLTQMGLRITDYDKEPALQDAINRYYTLLRLTFEGTNIFKVYETIGSQVYRFVGGAVPPPAPQPQQIQAANFDFPCPKCKTPFKIQANLAPGVPMGEGMTPYPANDIFVCPVCNTQSNLSQARLQIEAQSGKKVVQ
ncbi:MAG: hypothetical protein JNJ91_09555 [Flavobacteriales bacterium]|nr:hypothetical protein [Flavobacteriales bacterium]